MTAGQELVIRADAGAAMGTGHVMRCLAIAAAYGGASGAPSVHFVSALPLPARVDARVRSLGFTTRSTGTSIGGPEDAGATIAVARACGAAWVVVDGYGLGAEYEGLLGAAGLNVAALDDTGRARHAARVVINPNFHATRDLYEPAGSATRFLLGPEFALLRPEFWPWRGVPRTPRPSIERLLVTLGGSDPARLAPRVVRGLAPLGLEVRVVLGGADPSVEEAASEARAAGFDVVIDAPDMATHMAWADLAIATAGGTLLELCFMGTPTLAIVAADNQRPGADAAGRLGLARTLGWHADVSAEQITRATSAFLADPGSARELGERGRVAVDGRGAERVCSALRVE